MKEDRLRECFLSGRREQQSSGQLSTPSSRRVDELMEDARRKTWLGEPQGGRLSALRTSARDPVVGRGERAREGGWEGRKVVVGG
jgi:hypothetical protein